MMSRVLLAVLMCSAGPGVASAQSAFAPADVLAKVQQRVVKVYGGRIGREGGYASGVVVSADGRVVTVSGSFLEGRAVRVVLADGRGLEGRIVARDERRQLALLQIDATNLPSFELSETPELTPGDWVIAAGNAFKVADGDEPVSVSVGVFGGRTTLEGRRRAQDFAFDGEVLLTDTIVSAPGCAGGALTDLDGRLVGVIGRAVISNRTNTWMNYALPLEEVRAFLASAEHEALSENAARASEAPDGPHPRAVTSLVSDLGLRLFDVGGRERPAFVERVTRGSPAFAAGVRPDDLILSVNGERTATCAEVRAAILALRTGQPIRLSIKRGEQILQLDVALPTAGSTP